MNMSDKLSVTVEVSIGASLGNLGASTARVTASVSRSWAARQTEFNRDLYNPWNRDEVSEWECQDRRLQRLLTGDTEEAADAVRQAVYSATPWRPFPTVEAAQEWADRLGSRIRDPRY